MRDAAGHQDLSGAVDVADMRPTAARADALHILMLRPQIEIGGVTTHLALLIHELSVRGHRVSAVTTDLPQNRAATAMLERAGAHLEYRRLYPSTPGNLASAVASTVTLVKAHKIDVLHSHHRFTTIVGRIVSALTAVPLVVTVHEFKRNWQVLAPLWTANIMITPSVALADHMHRFYRVPTARLRVVPHALHAEHLLDVVEPEPVSAERPACVAYIGRLSAEKGCADFVASMPAIRQLVPDVRFAIIGAGPEEDALRRQVAALGIEPADIFRGVRTDIAQVLAETDIIVLPSRAESFALVALEAMFAARPVVGTAVGGIPEVVRDRQTGLLVPPASPDALAAAVSALLADETLRRRLGRQGRAVARAEYEPSVVVTRTVDAYYTALGTGGEAHGAT